MRDQLDNLYTMLQRYPDQRRDLIVSALKEGVAPEIIEEMLDHLENQERCFVPEPVQHRPWWKSLWPTLVPRPNR